MPDLYLFGGPNGAGKTTTARRILPDFLSCREFVNADAIASALSPFRPETVARQAARLMLLRLAELVCQKQSFAFESTLASRGFVSFLKNCRESDYQIHLLYIWLHSADLAVERVKARVRSGGHSIPEDVIRRRYERGLKNFFDLYVPLCDSWTVLNNSTETQHSEIDLVASGGATQQTLIHQAATWDLIQAQR